jgi:anti-sigma regulatory factor (Ser/Thr protein kinase)
MQTVSFSVRFPNEKKYAHAARRCAMQFVTALGAFSDEQLDEIEIALGEGLANTAEHGFCDGSLFEVRSSIDRNDLIITIEDAGPGFDLFRLLKDAKSSRDGQLRGYGIDLIHAFVDEVAYLNGGRTLRMKKRFSTASRTGSGS